MANVLVTGSSRGLGLAFVKELASLPASQIGTIFATSRGELSSYTDLSSLIKSHNGRIIFVQLDTTSKSSIASAVTAVSQHLNHKGLDILINNAGIQKPFPTTNPNPAIPMILQVDNLTEHFTTNVSAVQNVTSAFFSLLQASTAKFKKVINISSATGSLTWTTRYGGGMAHAYRISKTALNMLTAMYAVQFAGEGFVFVAMCPGWVRTDLGGSKGDLSVEQSAKAVIEVAMKADASYNGVYQNVRVPGWEHARSEGRSRNEYPGDVVPW